MLLFFHIRNPSVQITGSLFGVHAVYGLLTGAILTSVQLAISMSNAGGAWDNTKKFIAATPADSVYGGKTGEPHTNPKPYS